MGEATPVSNPRECACPTFRIATARLCSSKVSLITSTSDSNLVSAKWIK